jgi:two-component system, OmpR family, sensor kinase
MTDLRLPLAVKVPLVVMAFMAMVAIFVSERVLTRLAAAQTRHLEDLAAVHLDGLATALIDPVIREDVWEIFDVLDRARQRHAGLKPTATVVATREGDVLASSAPRAIPSRTPLPASFLSQAASAPALVVREPEGRAVARRDLVSGGQAVGSVHAAFDIAPLLAERRAVLWTLVATNAALTLALALIAWLTVRRMMRPVGILAGHLKAGAVEPISAAEMKQARGEFRGLFGAFNGMVEAVREREALARRLAEEERIASLGRLASGMAHEINNPLGGILNAVETLKQHGARPEVRSRTLDLVERGLKGIRDVVQATLVVYRTDRETRNFSAADIDDLQLLLTPELRRKRLELRWSNELAGEVGVRAAPMRQVLLNLLLNACQAGPAGSCVTLKATADHRGLCVVVEDEGSGLPDNAVEMLSGRLAAPLAAGRGLGLWMIRRLVDDLGGTVSAERREPAGAAVRVVIPLHATRELAHVA